eukprot:215933-Pelagomonas_calceolata.AAC.1
MSMSTHLQAQILLDTITCIILSEANVHFYKVKSHNGILGNEGVDALALQAAMSPHKADTSLNQAENPFFHLYWFATPVKKPGSHTEL